MSIKRHTVLIFELRIVIVLFKIILSSRDCNDTNEGDEQSDGVVVMMKMIESNGGGDVDSDWDDSNGDRWWWLLTVMVTVTMMMVMVTAIRAVLSIPSNSSCGLIGVYSLWQNCYKNKQEKKHLFWFTVSDLSSPSHMDPLLWTCEAWDIMEEIYEMSSDLVMSLM